MFCSVYDKLETNFNFCSDILAADLILTEAECSTLLCSFGARAPAYRPNAISTVLTGWITESTTLLLIVVASKRAGFTRVGTLSA